MAASGVLSLVGIVLAVPFLAWTRGDGRRLAAGLLLAALLYLGFALEAGRGLLQEAAGFLGFTPFVWLGIRRHPHWLALGWALHMGWDTLHLLARGHPVAPTWYALLCLGFDLAVVAYCLHPAGAARGTQYAGSTLQLSEPR